MVSFLAPVVILLLALDNKYVGILTGIFSRGRSSSGEAYEFFFISSLILFLILIPFAIFRIYSIRKLFGNSKVVKGHVTHAPYVKDRGTFKYKYIYNNQEYSSWNLVHRTKETKSIAPGQEVEIVVNINNPSKAFIRQLYV